jgi:hypothetical protein
MAIKIDDDCMTLEIGGEVISQARQRPDGRWEVSQWPKLLDRNQAVTTLIVAELLASGRRDDDLRVATFRKELR